MLVKRRSLVAAAVVVVACFDGPAGPDVPRIAFSITARTEVPSKSVIDVMVQVTEANRVEFPLIVTYEVAYVGDPLVEVSRFFLFGDQRIAVARIPVRIDATIRVTVKESGPEELSESKTFEVNVLDFP